MQAGKSPRPSPTAKDRNCLFSLFAIVAKCPTQPIDQQWTVYLLVSLNINLAFPMRDHSHRIDRSNRLKQDKSEWEIIEFNLNEIRSCAGQIFSNQFNWKYCKTQLSNSPEAELYHLFVRRLSFVPNR